MPLASWSQAPTAPAEPAPALVLAGGTVIDVTNWGRSAKDLKDAVIVVREGRITEVGSRSEIPIPRDARVIDCTGKFIIPGLVDGYAGMSTQSQSNADLYMGVTTVVTRSDSRHGHVDFNANPRPHLYLIDSIGTTDNWSLLIGHGEWTSRLKEGAHPAELSPEDTARQLIETAHLGTRVLWLGPDLTAANTQWIISRAHQMGLVTYGEFISTPYRVGIQAGVDALIHMGRYELGLIPDELQRPLVDDPYGSTRNADYDYAQHLPPTDPHIRDYARFIASHHAALMPTFSTYYSRLPGHRNLWREPAASLLNPVNLYRPTNPATGELNYSVSNWARHLPGMAQRWMTESQRKKDDQAALRLWNINAAIFAAQPHYLAASGAPVTGSMPGISMHTELELLVRLGLSSREALAAATNNYSLQFGWTELGLIAPGRRADILVLDSNPTANIWNVRGISILIKDGRVIDREALLKAAAR
ncbi:MAG TPA: amidohydrolase family protein [Terracidiphilus sp.]|nr:amidohydrolase family protein [Terracidiphilus sp.]